MIVEKAENGSVANGVSGSMGFASRLERPIWSRTSRPREGYYRTRPRFERLEACGVTGVDRDRIRRELVSLPTRWHLPFDRFIHVITTNTSRVLRYVWMKYQGR
jgi:hypothetical protein